MWILDLLEIVFPLLSERVFDASVEAEKRKQARRLLARGRELLWQGRFEDAEAQFGAAKGLDRNAIDKLRKREQQRFLLALGKSGAYGPNSRELYVRLQHRAK